eukprot:TRINITY_DN1338_c0_g4_i1.p1 TRINITY_DN1338_c0_g4~~TRINITY_DN1338_c0_g4_i1.p1  ORF type:complete len:770 (+),score=215.17 TRINITY_DN1338_c0_g4_i1:71-2311(+)
MVTSPAACGSRRPPEKAQRDPSPAGSLPSVPSLRHNSAGGSLGQRSGEGSRSPPPQTRQGEMEDEEDTAFDFGGPSRRAPFAAAVTPPRGPALPALFTSPRVLPAGGATPEAKPQPGSPCSAVELEMSTREASPESGGAPASAGGWRSPTRASPRVQRQELRPASPEGTASDGAAFRRSFRSFEAQLDLSPRRLPDAAGAAEADAGLEASVPGDAPPPRECLTGPSASPPVLAWTPGDARVGGPLADEVGALRARVAALEEERAELIQNEQELVEEVRAQQQWGQELQEQGREAEGLREQLAAAEGQCEALRARVAALEAELLKRPPKGPTHRSTSADSGSSAHELEVVVRVLRRQLSEQETKTAAAQREAAAARRKAEEAAAARAAAEARLRSQSEGCQQQRTAPPRRANSRGGAKQGSTAALCRKLHAAEAELAELRAAGVLTGQRGPAAPRRANTGPECAGSEPLCRSDEAGYAPRTPSHLHDFSPAWRDTPPQQAPPPAAAPPGARSTAPAPAPLPPAHPPCGRDPRPEDSRAGSPHRSEQSAESSAAPSPGSAPQPTPYPLTGLVRSPHLERSAEGTAARTRSAPPPAEFFSFPLAAAAGRDAQPAGAGERGRAGAAPLLQPAKPLLRFPGADAEPCGRRRRGRSASADVPRRGNTMLPLPQPRQRSGTMQLARAASSPQRSLSMPDQRPRRSQMQRRQQCRRAEHDPAAGPAGTERRRSARQGHARERVTSPAAPARAHG